MFQQNSIFSSLPSSGSSVANIIRSGVTSDRHKQRFIVTSLQWRDMVVGLANDPIVFLGMWTDGDTIHALFLDDDDYPLIASMDQLDASRYHALSINRPVAVFYEVELRENWGIEAMNANWYSPWLDQNTGSDTIVLSSSPTSFGIIKKSSKISKSPENRDEFFLNGGEESHAEGYGLALSVIGQRIQAARYRFKCSKQMLRRSLQGRALCTNFSLAIPGLDVVIAHRLAFARAVEQALELSVPPIVQLTRDVYLEIERIVTLGRALHRFAQATGAEFCVSLCEKFVRYAEDLTRPIIRLDCLDPLVDNWVPNREMLKVALIPENLNEIKNHITFLEKAFRYTPGLYNDLRGCAVLTRKMALTLALGGPAGAASGRQQNIRNKKDKIHQYRAYPGIGQCGDTADRLVAMLAAMQGAIEIIIDLIRQISHHDESGYTQSVSHLTGEGIGVSEGPWGDIWYWVDIENAVIKDLFVRDPMPALFAACSYAMVGEWWVKKPAIEASFFVNPIAIRI